MARQNANCTDLKSTPWVFCITALMIAAGCGEVAAPASSAFSIKNGYKSYNDGVAFITIVNPVTNKHKFCSGVYVSPFLVLTSKHCVKDQNPSNVVVWDVDNIEDRSGDNGHNVYKIHVPTNQQWPHHATVTPDFAVVELQGTDAFKGKPIPVATTLPNLSNIATFQGKIVDIYGFSHNIDNGNEVVTGGNKHRLAGKMKVFGSGPDFNGLPTFALVEDAKYNQRMMGGDCGGPVILNGEVIGLLVGDESSTPVKNHVAYVVPNLLSAVIAATDADQDGWTNAADNCPQVANADQANCNANDEPITPTGDACDSTPCVYLSGVQSVEHKTTAGYLVNVAAAVDYRGVGHVTATQPYPHLLKDVEAFFCACHAPSASPPQITTYTDEYCDLNVCKTNADPLSSDKITDTGWRRMIWAARNDTPGAPISTSSCTLVDSDNQTPPFLNDCESSVPNRLFRKPYADSTLGAVKGDWQKYWKEPKKYRTRTFGWDWRKEDYPHLASVPYTAEANDAKVKLWIRPQGYTPVNPTSHNKNNFSKYFSISVWLKTLLPEALRLPKPWERWRHLGGLIGDELPPGFWPDHLVVLPLSMERDHSDLGHTFWNPMPSTAATKGLIIRRYNAHTGIFTDDIPCDVDVGSPVFTKNFAATTDPRTGTIYIFGGQDSNGGLPPMMWRGDPYQTPEGARYHFVEIGGPDMPLGRANAVLHFDQERERLVLMFGETEQGEIREALAFDLEASNWSTLSTAFDETGTTILASRAIGGGKLFLYGGSDEGVARDGLYVIDLDTMTGWRADAPGTGPGARYNAQMYYDKDANSVYLFGGNDDDGRRADLWVFHVGRKSWDLLADEDTPGAPQRMEFGAVVTSSVSGKVSVLPGQTDAGAQQSMWMFSEGAWLSADELKSPEE